MGLYIFQRAVTDTIDSGIFFRLLSGLSCKSSLNLIKYKKNTDYQRRLYLEIVYLPPCPQNSLNFWLNFVVINTTDVPRKLEMFKSLDIFLSTHIVVQTIPCYVYHLYIQLDIILRTKGSARKTWSPDAIRQRSSFSGGRISSSCS